MYLITGANGFLGRQIYRAIAEQGVYSRLVLREGANLSPAAKTDIIYTNDLFSEAQQWWAQALTGIDCVLHVAWYTQPGDCLVSQRNLDCLAGTLDLAQACARVGVRRFVGVGTCFEYDLDQGMLTVDTPLRPCSLYAATKASAYLTLKAYFATKNIEFSWCRPFYLYGEGEDSRRLIPYLHKQLAAGEIAELTDGNQIRDYMDVTDAGRMIAQVAMGKQCGPVNICSGVPTTVRQMAETIADQYDRRDLLKFGVRPYNLTDPPCVVGKCNVYF